MNMNNTSAREYIKQMWFNYPTLFDSKFAVLHSIFSKGQDIGEDGIFFHLNEIPEGFTSFKNKFADYQSELERKLLETRRTIIAENIDYFLDEYLPISEKVLGVEKASYITNYYIYHVSDDCFFFKLNANVRKDWLEAALEMGEYWIDILHSWNYYHPTESMKQDMVKLRDKCDEICKWLGRPTRSERDVFMCNLINEILNETKQ